MLKVLAFDYGASSGRAILGRFDGEVLKLDEMHRFSNDPVLVGGSFYWDTLRLYHEMKQGILKCLQNGYTDLAGIGTDTWGCDYGLLDKSGRLMANPYHYRDNRTDGMIEEACKLVPKREIYEHTGIQFLKFNTLYQLLATKLSGSAMLEQAKTLLLMPDLLNYFLTGEKVSERTEVSTTQMYNPITGDWAKPLLEKLGIPTHMLTDIADTGAIIGRISGAVREELNVGDIPVIAVAEHDTGSAVVSVPTAGGPFAYLSSGTWSLLGVESDVPVINDNTYELNYTNEGGINRTTRLLKNIMGLWIYQECKRTWDKAGEGLSFDELEERAAASDPFVSLINPDEDMFMDPGHMPDKVRDYCSRTGQKVPETKAAIVRCIMESLALKYRYAVEGLERIVGYKLPVIHIVGGGCRNTMLCQFTANATGKQVIAGPVEATSVGNVMSQLIALKEIASLQDARMITRKSFPMVEYEPKDRSRWDDEYGRFLKLIGK